MYNDCVGYFGGVADCSVLVVKLNKYGQFGACVCVWWVFVCVLWFNIKLIVKSKIFGWRAERLASKWTLQLISFNKRINRRTEMGFVCLCLCVCVGELKEEL